jgi:hypothetical protein
MKNSFQHITRLMIVSLALLLSLNGSATAQEITGTINGTVRDASDAVVPGATVTITDPSKDNAVVRTLTTNNDGEFNAPNLLVSTYSVTVESANFKRSVQTDVKLEVGQRRSVDFTLEAGNVSEIVTVEADQVAVELSTPTAGTTISGNQVRELSINNRNFVQLVTLAPGVSNNLADQVYVGTTNPDGQANTVQISVNGARSSQNTFTVDGADITDRGSNLTIQAYPSVDSIGEFRVLRSLYPAESGRSGGGQVNVVTRSGTDEFHGSLFEFVRNEKFNANTFFNNQRAPFGRDENGAARRAPFRYNNFGGTIGGPVYGFNFGDGGDSGIFKKYKKTYFFFSEEQRRDVRFPTLISSVPSAGLRQGIFPIDICLSATIAGTTRTCANVLPAGTPLSSRAAINPVAQAYITNIYNKLPEPNNPLVPFQLVAPANGRSNFRQEIFKLDTSFTNDWSAFYRFQNDKIPTVDVNALFSAGSGIPGVSTTETNSPGRTHTFQTTYVVSPNVIAEGRYNYSYGAILSENTGLIARRNSPIEIPLAYNNTTDRIPNIIGNGFNNLAGFGPYDNFSNKHDISGNLTWIIGNHTTKYGANFSKYRKNENALGGINNGSFSGFLNTTAASATQGTVCATSVAATGICPTANNVASLQTFANFLLGTNVAFTQAKFDLEADFRQRNFEAYAQDEFRIRQNLTLYAGVRYSFFGAPWDKNGFLSNFDPALFDPKFAPQVNSGGNRINTIPNPIAGQPPLPARNEFGNIPNFCNGLIVNSQNVPSVLPPNCTPTISPYGKFIVDAKKRNFAPRIGLAWDPFGEGRTAIRMGYGIYHEQTLVGTFLQNLGANPPFQETIAVTQTRLDQPIAPGSTPAAVSSLAAQTLRAEQTDWKTPYMQHWSLDLQQQLTSKTLVTVGYFGSKGTNLIGIVDINLLPAGLAASTPCAGAPTTNNPSGFCQIPGVPFFGATEELRLDQLRPYRGYRAINMIQPRFDSNYHSLQVSGKQRFNDEISEIGLAYTWSKNLTNSQTDRSTAPQNPYDLASEYGLAALDRRHILTANYVYELPFYRTQQGFIGKILGGLQTSGIVTYQSGLPLTATFGGYDPAGIGFLGPSASGPRPDQIGNPNQGGARTQAQWFNTAAFQTTFPATGVANNAGSAGRGTIVGPSLFRVDFTLAKNIRFSETMRLQLRAEAFNIFNKTNFTTINTLATSTTFGQVTGTRDPRTMQFAIKYYF